MEGCSLICLLANRIAQKGSNAVRVTMYNPADKPTLANNLPKPQEIGDRELEQIRQESRRDREAMDTLVRNMQSVSSSELKIRLK